MAKVPLPGTGQELNTNSGLTSNLFKFGSVTVGVFLVLISVATASWAFNESTEATGTDDENTQIPVV